MVFLLIRSQRAQKLLNKSIAMHAGKGLLKNHLHDSDDKGIAAACGKSK